MLFVIAAGLLWMTAGTVLLEVSRILGPSFHTKVTVHIGWRILTWIAGLICFIRGMTLLFPGKLVEVSRISAMAPLGALVVCGLSLVVLDWVMRDRAPPPWSVQMMRLAAVLGTSGPIKFAAMAVPPAAVGDMPPVDEPHHLRRSRLPVLIGAVLIVAGIAVFLALNSPATAAAAG
ncbi:hypothetical protein [Brevundimonas sp.]|uniref:hypothetical protein n=1 Tax=Brevundimonas sp. TaxID=1871086 RepID=UPI002FCC81EA